MRAFLSQDPVQGAKAAAREAGFATRLSWLYAATFVMGGIQLPFFPVWLKAKGLDPGMIGLVLAAPIVARIVALPVITHAADRYDAVRAAIIATCVLSIAGYVLVGLSGSGLAILLAFTFASLAMTPVMPLTETYALRGLSARGRAYGPVRLWGSLAFIVGTFAAGSAADLISATYLIWLIVAASVGAAVAAVMLAPLAIGTPSTTRPPTPARHMLRSPAFIAVIAAASLIQASHAVFYGFSAVAWRSGGLDGMAIAALWGLGVAAEIALFAFSARLPLFFTPSIMLLIGAGGGVLRWTVMAFDPPALLLPVLQLLHGLTFGATHLGALMYVSRNAPQGQAAKAQGYLAIAIGVTMAGATGLSGVLYGAFGAKAYAAMALLAIAGGASAAVAHRTRRVTAL
jgi:PPP family 3-phenylpropionic acid transporter